MNALGHRRYRALPLCGLLLVCCADKAKPYFTTCERLQEQGRTADALEQCERAIDADPASQSAKAAAALVSKLRADMAAAEAARGEAERAEAQKRSQAERKRLLMSADPADWQKLVTGHGGTPEADEASKKISAFESICVDRTRWSITRAVERLRDRSGQAAMLSEMSAVAAAAGAEGLSEKCEEEASRLEAAVDEVNTHKTRSGEETIQKDLATDLELLRKENKKWAGAFAAYEGDLAPFVAAQQSTLRLAETLLGRDTDRMSACLAILARRDNGAKPAAPAP